MISARLLDTMYTVNLLKNQIIQESLDWLKQNAAGASIGVYEFEKSGWFADVHTYITQSEAKCVWESHEETVDLQYLIEGEEGIEWAPINALGTLIKRFSDRDRLEWNGPLENCNYLVMRPGMYAIFLPSDAHRPMIALQDSVRVRKVVIKIPLSLVMESYNG